MHDSIDGYVIGRRLQAVSYTHLYDERCAIEDAVTDIHSVETDF